jgi:hypothetical protein
LFAEIWFLSEVLLPCLECDSAVRAWVGPLGSNQDFQLPRCSVEIKSCASTAADKVVVSNLVQLDSEGLANLVMSCFLLEVRRQEGLSLPALVDRVRASLGSASALASSTFDSLLVMSGYLEAHAHAYENRFYRVLKASHFLVTEGFPCLTRSQVPDGVCDVKYSIEISVCAPHEITADRLINLISGE